MCRQEQRAAVPFDDRRVKNQELVRSRGDAPIEPPFEKRRRKRERKWLEQIPPVDMEKDLGPQPTPRAPGSRQARVKIGNAIAVRQAELRVQEPEARDHARQTRLQMD